MSVTYVECDNCQAPRLWWPDQRYEVELLQERVAQLESERDDPPGPGAACEGPCCR